MLQHAGISLESDLLEKFDRLIGQRGYENRSEAIRDLIREQLVQEEWTRQEKDGTDKVAVVLLVYDHDSSSLPQKLSHIQHEHHKVVVSTLLVRLDKRSCLEMLILRGHGSEIISMGESLVSTKGVKYGKVVPATTGRRLK
jgi:CopG family nickel-responsive transcriptional regulator